MNAQNLDENLARAAELKKESNRSGFAFIATDLETSLTFAALARQAGNDEEKRSRNIANALKGYRAITYFMGKFDRSTISAPELANIELKLAELRAALEELGNKLS